MYNILNYAHSKINIHYAQSLYIKIIHYAHSYKMTFEKKKYDQKYVKDNYSRIPLNVKKEEKELIIQRAKEKGFPDITKYIKDLINKDLNNKDLNNHKNINVQNVNQIGDNNSININ